MRTNIDIDKKLMTRARSLSKASSKRETVEIALKHYIVLQERKKLLNLFGKVNWEGNLKEMRAS